MGILTNLFKGGETVKGVAEGVGGLAKDITSIVTGKLDPEKQAEFDLSMNKMQAEINKLDAQSQHGFQRNWRPFIGWVSGLGLTYHFLFMPIFYDLFQKYLKFSLQPIDGATLTSLVVALLGLGTMRTLEKANGTQSNH